MKSALVILLFPFIVGCENNQREIIIQEADSVLQQSNKHIYEYNEAIKKVDSQVAERVKIVVFEMEVLQQENKKLKSDFQKVKRINRVVRDTIYITERKNFWGKTKKIIDSSQTIIQDSSQTENK